MIAAALLWAGAGIAAPSPDPPSAPIGIADIVEVADPSSLAVSPDGRLVALDRKSVV